MLLFVGPVEWVWDDKPLVAGPVLRRLAEMQGVGLVSGRLQDLRCSSWQRQRRIPIWESRPPPPNYLLEAHEYHSAEKRPGRTALVSAVRRHARRLGLGRLDVRDRVSWNKSTIRCSID